MAATSPSTGTPFDFHPGTHPVGRHVHVHAPDQQDRTKKTHKLEIQAQPLPAEPDFNNASVKPPVHKGITRLIRTVIHPKATYADDPNFAPLTFDPPLTLTVYYTPDDLKNLPAGAQLALITYYKEDQNNIWHWEKLPTTVDTTNQTLTAQVATLNPLDPVGVGH